MGDVMNAGGGGGGAKITVEVGPQTRTSGVLTSPPAYPAGGMFADSCTDIDGNVYVGGVLWNHVYSPPSGVSVVAKYTPDGKGEMLDNLTSFRNYTGMCALGDGGILVAGGIIPPSNTYTAEVNKYDRHGKISTVANLSVARTYTQGCMDGDGNGLIIGGRSSSAPVATVDRYNRYGEKISGATMSTPRVWFGVSRDGNGNVVVGGGYTTGSLSAVDRIDKTGVVTSLTPLTGARHYLGAATDGNGDVWFVGGYNSNVVDKYSTSGVKTTMPNLTVSMRYVVGSSYGISGRMAFAMTSSMSIPPSVYVSDMAGNMTLLGTSRIKREREDWRMTSDIAGNVIFSALDGTLPNYGILVSEIWYSPDAKAVRVPAHNAYKFAQHETEQPAEDHDIFIAVAPNTAGYFRPKKGAISA